MCIRDSVYSDATLGWVTSWESLRGIFAQFMPDWGDGVAYATAVLGLSLIHI